MAKIVVVSQRDKTRCCKKVNFGNFTPKLIAQALVIVAVFGVFIFALPTLPQTPTNISGANYQGVVNLWLVDSFEGGSGSRSSWFTKRSAQFEKQHKGLFVCVTPMTESQLQQNLEQGQSFDILCFSRGIGCQIADKLAPMDVDGGNVFHNFLQSGKLHGKSYALPVYCGTYALFARQSQLKGDLLQNCLSATFTRKVGKNTVMLQPLVCGFANYNNPLFALATNGARGQVKLDYNTTQYTAYEQFIANKTAVTLLGTQRDIFRLCQKFDMGKIEPLTFCPLTNYTDLVQYVGVNKDTQKSAVCNKFVQYLLSDTVQQSLTNIAMFSVTQQNLYTNEWYSSCEKAIANMQVPNVFADQESIAMEKIDAIEQLKGDNNGL